MQNELIVLKVKKESFNDETAKVIGEQFLKACKSLDASIFEPLISEEQYFQNLDKYRFLASLKEQFDWAKNRGAKDVYVKTGKCLACVCGQTVYDFFSGNGNHEFAYGVTTENGYIIDIFLCNMSTGSMDVNDEAEFVNSIEL